MVPIMNLCVISIYCVLFIDNWIFSVFVGIAVASEIAVDDDEDDNEAVTDVDWKWMNEWVNECMHECLRKKKKPQLLSVSYRVLVINWQKKRLLIGHVLC